MRSSGLRVRRFSSAAQERAFRRDYARRFSGQRRLAIAIFTALRVVFSIRDFPRLNALDPAHLNHNELILLRVAGAIGMAIPVRFWTPRALDERWAVGLLSVWTISCWFTTLRMLPFYPGDLGWREVYPVLMLSLFVIFMAFRLRVTTAAWLIGICIVSYLIKLSNLIDSLNRSKEWSTWRKPYFRFRIPHRVKIDGRYRNDFHQWDRLKEISSTGVPTFYATNTMLEERELKSLFESCQLLDRITLLDVAPVKRKHVHASFADPFSNFLSTAPRRRHYLFPLWKLWNV